MKAVRFSVTGPILMQFLHLPEGSVLRGAEMTEDGRDAVLIVEHPDLPEADVPAKAWPHYRRHDSAEFVDWGLL